MPSFELVGSLRVWTPTLACLSFAVGMPTELQDSYFATSRWLSTCCASIVRKSVRDLEYLVSQLTAASVGNVRDLEAVVARVRKCATRECAETVLQFNGAPKRKRDRFGSGPLRGVLKAKGDYFVY